MRPERIFFGLLFGILAVLAVIIMWPFLTYIVLAGILAYTLFPVYRFFNRHTRRPEMASALSILLALLLMVLPSFFLVSELVQQVSGAYSNFQAENIQRVADYLSGLTGNRIDFQGLLSSGISNWLFWGAIMIIMAFLPLLGTPLIWVPAAVSQILDGETARGVGLLIYGSTIVMNIDNVLRPRLMSGRTKVHPVLILLGVLGGLKIFGFIGMLVGPLILAVLVAFTKFYEQAYLHRKFTVGPAAD